MLQNPQNTGKVQPNDSGAGHVRQQNRTRLTDEERLARKREYQRAYYQRTIERRREWQREYYRTHGRTERQREYYQRNRDAILAKQRERDFRRKCRECGVSQ